MDFVHILVKNEDYDPNQSKLLQIKEMNTVKNTFGWKTR